VENLASNAPNQEPGVRLAHGFKRTLFGFSPSFKRNSSLDRYGYLFGTKSKAGIISCSDANRQVLEQLGRSMIDLAGSDDAAGSSGIDSGLVYFGQFVDHDLTFDVDSKTSIAQDAAKLTNYRTPNLDLDSLYGDGPAVDSFMYDSQGLKFVLGRTSGAGHEFDLPRTIAGLAIIGDPRNDENLFVAQFHMSLLRFHNAVVDQLQEAASASSADELFRQAQREVRRHYQWVVFHDYLRKIIGEELVEDVLNNGPKFFTRAKFPTFFMPVEFSVAAYRFGHSMIRDRYRFNRNFSDSDFMNAFGFTKGTVPSIWNVHWPSFFGSNDQPAANRARKIDTRVAVSMSRLPTSPGAPSNNLFAILSARNLVRSMALQVPTGQYVARKMGQAPLSTEQLLTSPYPNPTPEQLSQHQQTTQALQSNNGFLLKQTPLWYYVLKEAEVLHGGEQLGPVGGRILADVFIRLLIDSEEAFVHHPDWQPRFGWQGGDPKEYKIADLLSFAGTFPVPGLQ
jgi:hypothetical protein